MLKNIKPMEIKLSQEDVMAAVELWLNEKSFYSDGTFEVVDIVKTRAEGYFLMVTVNGND